MSRPRRRSPAVCRAAADPTATSGRLSPIRDDPALARPTPAWALAVLATFVLLTAGCDLALPGAGSDASGMAAGPLPVVFLTHRRPASLPAEERAALEWARAHENLDIRVLQLVDLPAARVPVEAVLWWHYAEATALPSAAVSPRTLAAARRHLRRGGGMVLSLLAASWVVPLGLENVPPDTVGAAVRVSAAASGTRGLQSRNGHPALRRFRGGIDVDRVTSDETVPATFYSGERWPEQGRVWAVERRGNVVLPTIRPGVEYPPTAERAGTLITVGAHLRFTGLADGGTPHVGLLVWDLLRYVTDRTPSRPPRTATPRRGSRPAGDPPAATPRLSSEPAGSPAGGRLSWWERPSGPPARRFRPAPGPAVPAPADPGSRAVERPGLATDLPDGGRLTLAGTRAVARVTGRGRIETLWSHPERMLADLRFGVARAGKPVAWLDSVGNRRLVRRPGIIELQWQLPEIQLDAVLELTVPAGLPALVARIRVNAREPVDVVAAWEATHGPGWLEDGLTEPLLLGRQPRSGAAVWRDRRSEFHALAGFSRQIDRAVVGYQPWRHLGPGGLREPGRSRLADDALGSASVALQTHHAPGQPALAFVVAGDRAPLSEVEEAWAALLAEPAAAFTAPSDGSPNAAPRSQLEIGTDRPQVNEALRWLLSGFRALQAEPPDVESPVLAAAHRSGGSDLGSGALWGVLAANDLGDHGLAAATLRHLARHRWPDGTIPGRLEPLGPSHASPQIGTPLFVLAAADTVRVTDDAVLADDLWPAVVGALAACRRSDRDGDGLMDHLGTPPPPLDTVEDLVAEVSLAGLHAAAVAAAARLARARDDGVTAARLEAEALTLRDALNDGFWNGPARYHVLGRSDEGPLLLRTVFPALPLALGMLNPGEGSALLEPLASAAMTTDWGVAWLDRTHPDPGNPLSGPVEVHPLHTAWTTLAEYRAHRATPAWGHLATQLELLMAAGGRLPRRLRVDRLEEMGEPAESLGGYALSIVALVRGTLGIRSDARQALLEIVPQLPADWGRVSIESLRIGPQVFRLALRQSDDLLLYEFDRVEGKETSSVELLLGARVPGDVAVDLDPEVTRGVELLAEPRVESSQSARIARVRVRPVASHFTVGFRQGLHPRVVVEPTIPAPGQASSGLRIHAPTFRDDSLSVPVEGLPGRSYLLRLATPWRVDGVGGVPGAIVSAPGPGRAEVRFQIPGTGEQHRRVELEMTFRR